MSKYVNASGEIDSEAIAADLAKIVEAKPHLGKGSATPPAPQTPKPDPSQGSRGGAAARPTSLSAAVKAATAPKT